MTTKTTKTPATKPATKVEATATKPATKPAPKLSLTAPAVKPATKVEAPKIEAPATQPATKVEAPKTEKARKVRISKVDSAWTTLANSIFELSAKDSKSSVGQFIIKFFNDHKDAVITGEILAHAFVTEFKTKTGITPDEKWARRNVKLFIDKEVITNKAK